MTQPKRTRRKLLLVDDNAGFLEAAAVVLEPDFDCVCITDPTAVIKTCDAEEPDAVLLDLYFDGKPLGFDILTDILREHPFLPVIMWTESEAMEEELKAQELGAFHYVRKEAGAGDVLVVVDAALRKRRVLIQDAVLREDEDRSWGEFVYASETMARILADVPKMADSKHSILITGETGVGKGVLAREIHRRSPRAEGGALIVVECAALPDTIVENELFGHERGAFTGATSQKPGRCEAADKGTLFLDEIGDMPLVSQAKLLRLADEGKFRRLGSDNDRSIDIRIIAATNHSLDDDVREGLFRKDLLFRLNTLQIEIPPLRLRRADIVPLARHFAAASARDRGVSFEISPSAEVYLQAQKWSGNARELKHVVERACTLADAPLLRPSDLALPTEKNELPLNYDQAKKRVLEELKHSLAGEALTRNDGNVTQAAKELGISRQTFYHFLGELALAKKNDD